jgi:uncharacterized protein YdaU (DUF1376 family)
MNQSTFWIRHDATAHTDGKIIELKAQYGIAGYGMYWELLEMLYSNEGYLSKNAALMICKSNAIADAFVDACIDLELFYIADEKIFSKRLLEELAKKEEKSKKMRVNAVKKWRMDAKKKKHAKAYAIADAEAMPEKRREEKTERDIAAEAAKPPTRKPTTTKPLQEHLTGLAIYTIAKRFTFDNPAQIAAHVKRYLRASQSLIGYTPEQILRAFFFAYHESKTAGYEVKLETIGKKIHEHKDWELEPQYRQAFRDILTEYEQHKENVLSTSSYLLC